MKVAYLLGCVLLLTTTFSIVNAQSIIKLQRAGDPPETVTAPNIPSGPTDSNVGISCIYTIKGSSTNLGDPIQYFVDWGDGTNTGWVPSSSNITSPDTNYLVSKSWTSPGIYSVQATAEFGHIFLLKAAIL